MQKQKEKYNGNGKKKISEGKQVRFQIQNSKFIADQRILLEEKENILRELEDERNRLMGGEIETHEIQNIR